MEPFNEKIPGITFDWNSVFTSTGILFLFNLFIEFPSPPIRCSRSTYYGFGYDPVSDDYKLVRIVQLLGAKDEYFHSEAKVYSLRSNSWRRIKDFFFYFISYRQLGFLANNVLHLLAFKTPESSKRDLVGFDLRSEEFSLVELPDFSPSEVPLAFSKNGDKVLFHFKLNRDRRDSLVWYDLGSKRIGEVGIRGVPIVYDVDLYVESLVPLN
ncbi:hypothetical protein Gotri_012017, partial [Gossypium trilobum]|nr:hypothetical protein [Gossypium trilobum]